MFELPLVVCKFLELSNSLRMYPAAVCFKHQKNLLAQWNMVCTSGFVDDVIFPHKDPYGLAVGNEISRTAAAT